MDNAKDPAPPRRPTDEVEEASEESFPASDPPANQPLHTGGPVRRGSGASGSDAPTPRPDDPPAR